MNYVFTLIFFSLLSVSLIIEKKYYKGHHTPLVFFVDLWCAVGGVSNLGLFEYYLPSDDVNYMMLTMIICSMSFWIIFNSKNAVCIKSIRSHKCSISYQYYSLFLLELVFLLLMIPSFILAVKALISGVKMSYLRAYVYDAKNNQGFIEELRGLLAKPVMTLTSLLAVSTFFSKIEKRKLKVIWIFAILNIIIYTVSTAGRMAIVNVITFLIISIIIYDGNRVLSFMLSHKKQFIILLLCFASILFVSSQRSSQNITQSFYSYYFSGPVYLTQIIENNESIFSINNDFMYGTATFGFVCNFISYFLILVTHKSRGSLYMLGSVLTNNSYNVSPQIKVNAMCTCIYDFLVDWGYVGVIIGPLFVMYMAFRLYKLDEKHGSIVTKCLLIYYLNTLLNSIFKWGLISMEFSVLYIYLLFIEKTNPPQHKEK